MVSELANNKMCFLTNSMLVLILVTLKHNIPSDTQKSIMAIQLFILTKLAIANKSHFTFFHRTYCLLQRTIPLFDFPFISVIPVPSIKVFYLLCVGITLVLILVLLTRRSREESTAWKDTQVAGNGTVAGYGPLLDIKGLINENCFLVLWAQ